MKNAYASYYAHLIKLKTIANKQTLFLSHMLTMMVFDKSIRQNVVSLSPNMKRRIMSDIGAKTAEDGVLKAANSYLSRLQHSGLIKSVGGGDYYVDPECYGYATNIPLRMRMEAHAIYCSYEFTDTGVKEKHVIKMDDGKQIDIGVRQDFDSEDFHFIDSDGVKVEL